MIMIWAGLLTGFIMIGIKRCLHFLSPLQMPFVFLIVGLVVSVIIGTCISAAVASKIVRPVREVKKAMHRVEKGDFSQRLEVTGFNGEIDELIESYNKMAQELGGIEMFRENFINSFSHEFKTPIVSIQGFAKQLKKENLSEEKKQEYIDIIISESKRLTNLSSNILMLSKLENQQIDPKQFDVILTENMFGDILSDEAAMISGSLGMLASASLNDTKFGMYEPSHGSAPDIAGQDKANPIATILSASMLLRFSFDMDKEADAIDNAVKKVLEAGYRTGDIMSEDMKLVGCKEMGSLVADMI